MRKRWSKSTVDNQTIFDCVTEYLKTLPGLPHPETTIETSTTDSETTTETLITESVQDHTTGDIQLARAQARHQAGHYDYKDSNEEAFDINFIIFLILTIVAALLLLAIIPAVIACYTVKSLRDRNRSNKQADDEGAKILDSEKTENESSQGAAERENTASREDKKKRK
ncbi:hypothetical protein RB195_015914 [Necator americanus]|uniref:Uncharacterized protein n=1 Tax=Necator americanus TaxID=51031 RepID=A0ABR1E6R4_NECAM